MVSSEVIDMEDSVRCDDRWRVGAFFEILVASS